MRVLAIGEMLWDVFPEQELLGGAALNFCTNIERFGHSARLITAVGDDERGRRACERISEMGLNTSFIQKTSAASTGIALVSKDSAGEPSFTIVRPAAYDSVVINRELLKRAEDFSPNWLYLGTLFHTDKNNEAATRALLEVIPSVRCFYDMNLRSKQWDIDLIRRLCRLASVLKLNENELRIVAEAEGVASLDDPLDYVCGRISRIFEIPAICITLGARGCFVYDNGTSLHIDGHQVKVKDTVGAGDAFAAAFLHGYDSGFPLSETMQLANAVGALVASREGAVPNWTLDECRSLYVPTQDELSAL